MKLFFPSYNIPKSSTPNTFSMTRLVYSDTTIIKRAFGSKEVTYSPLFACCYLIEWT